MNKVILTGRLCKDIELRYTNNQNAVMQNSLAVKSDYKNADGEYDTQFINFVAWNQKAEFLNKYANKGNKILVEGRWNNRDYEKEDGTKVYISEVIADKVELLESSNKSAASDTQQPQNQYNDPFAEYGEEVTLDDSFLD